MQNQFENIHDSRFRNGKSDGSLHDNEAKEAVAQSTAEVLGCINDDDFGEITVFYYPELRIIKAHSMEISDVPENYELDVVMYAWEVFKCHYGEYGALGVDYDQIPTLESCYPRY